MPATSFVFTKIMVDDLAGAERFYKRTLGLKILSRVKREGDNPVEETILVVAGNENGARVILEQTINGAPRVTGEAILGFFVDDVDASVALALEAGARLVHPAKDNPEHQIRLALVADPEGHIVELLGRLT